jgi:hypothetical protein
MIYAGGCHCKRVRYTVDFNPTNVLSCNCSICTMKGHRLAFAPEANFKLISGNESLSDYQFGKKKIHHLFCKHCGINSFGRGTMPDGTKVVGINLNCLDDFDSSKLPIHHFDGKSL